MSTHKFEIGQKYMTRGKHPLECTVADRLTTRNNAGDVVKLAYVATHLFLDAVVTDYDVCETTIARGVAVSA